MPRRWRPCCPPTCRSTRAPGHMWRRHPPTRRANTSRRPCWRARTPCRRTRRRDRASSINCTRTSHARRLLPRHQRHAGDGDGAERHVRHRLCAASQAGQSQGTVTNAATLAPVPSARVYVFTSTGSYAASTSTNAQGGYVSPALLTGSYLVQTYAPSGSGLIKSTVPEHRVPRRLLPRHQRHAGDGERRRTPRPASAWRCSPRVRPGITCGQRRAWRSACSRWWLRRRRGRLGDR